MNIRYITYTGLDNNIEINDLVNLLNLSDNTALSIDADPETMSYGSTKYKWLENILKISKHSQKPFNIELNVNNHWCEKFCKGEIDPLLTHLFYETNKHTNTPIIQKWQLNVKGNEKCKAPGLAKIIQNNPNREFVLRYNKKIHRTLVRLDKIGAKTALLFDYMELPDAFTDPIFQNHTFIFKMKFNTDMTEYKLNKIEKRIPDNMTVDLKYKLKKETALNITKMQNFTRTILAWNKKNYLNKEQ